MDNLVYIDPALMEGAILRIAIFVKEIESWVLQSEAPETSYIDTYGQILRQKALEMYPELGELFEIETRIDHTISFVKDITSGKWIDFHAGN